MIPMVFWASLEPWLNPMAAAETIWSFPKRLLTVAGVLRAKVQEMAIMIR